MNLRNLLPDVSQEDICREIAVEFALEYLEDPLHGLLEKEISEEEINNNEECQKIKLSMQDQNYVYGKSSEFSNNFEKRFDWGVVDFNANVRNGVVEECRIYSDSLYPDMIDALQKEFSKGKYRYQKRDVNEIYDQTHASMKGDRVTETALKETCEWLKDMIE